MPTNSEVEDFRAIQEGWEMTSFESIRQYFGETFPYLTSTLSIGGLVAQNRVVLQPMEGNDCGRGKPSRTTLARYARFAAGSAGVVMIEATAVTPESAARINQLVLDANHTEGIEQIVKTIREVNQRTLIGVQLTHPGHVGIQNERLGLKVVRVYPGKTFDNLPSDAHYLTVDDIHRLQDLFVQSAKIAADSGVQIVDIKSCHGYLIGNFLRPANTRPDQYGGSLENRMRFAAEIIERVKKECPGLKIMVRFSMSEGTHKLLDVSPMYGALGTAGSNTIEPNQEEPREMLRILARQGVHILNITAGVPKYNATAMGRMVKMPDGFVVDDSSTYCKVPLLGYAKEASDLGLGIPVIASGLSLFGNKMAEVGEQVILSGMAQMVGIGRQSLADARVYKILKGGAGDAKFCAHCRQDSCAYLLANNFPVGCTVHDGTYKALVNSVRLAKGE